MILGVDAGASHMELALAERSGAIRDRRTVRPVAGIASNPGALADVLAHSALDMATGTAIACVIVGAAGAGTSEVRNTFQSLLARLINDALIFVTTDIEIAVTSGFPRSPGIVLASGTGSFAVRRNADLTTTRAGGLGPTAGDQGSGFYLATKAIERLSSDPDDSPRLGRALVTATGADDVAWLTAWSEEVTRSDIASLAKVVCSCAAEGDPLAKALLDDSANQLMKLVQALALDVEQLAVAYTGGLLSGGSPLRRVVESKVDATPGFTNSRHHVDPVVGAVTLGLERLAG